MDRTIGTGWPFIDGEVRSRRCDMHGGQIRDKAERREVCLRLDCSEVMSAVAGAWSGESGRF